MKKLLRFVLYLTLLSAIAVFLANQPGTARVIWRGMIIETSAATLGFTALIIGFVFYLLFRVWHLVRHGPRHWKLRRHVEKLKKGHNWLTQGLAAVAGGDAAEAGRMAVAARKHLGETAATQLLQAQAAQLAGDDVTARAIYRALAEEPASAIIGYRGLIMTARRNNDFAEMERLTDALQQIRPNTPWLKVIRFEIAARQQKWDKAGEALAAPAVEQLMGKEKARRARAAVLIVRSDEEAHQGNLDKALQAAEQAARQTPDWLPAILNVARCQIAAGHERAARRTIEKNWVQTPHPQLAALYRPNDEDPIVAFKKIEKLCRDNSDAAISHLVIGEAALDADLWGEARRHFMTLIARNQATQSVYRMIAKLERRGDGNESAALQWLTKAADAAPDPVWLCRACGGGHKDWRPTCTHCGGFITLEWQSPGVSRAVTDPAINAQPLLLTDWME